MSQFNFVSRFSVSKALLLGRREAGPAPHFSSWWIEKFYTRFTLPAEPWVRGGGSTSPPARQPHVNIENLQQICLKHLPPAVNYICPQFVMLMREESSHFPSYQRLGSQQNAKPDLGHLEQLKLFLLLAKVAINWKCWAYFLKKISHPKCNLFWRDNLAFDREMLRCSWWQLLVVRTWYNSLMDHKGTRGTETYSSQLLGGDGAISVLVEQGECLLEFSDLLLGKLISLERKKVKKNIFSKLFC